MSKRFLSGINVTGTATLNTVANAGLDTDKFLVLDAAGNVDFRTGDELKIDIGADRVSRVEHEVKLGATMTIGTPVYVPISQDSGTNMTVLKASNASEATSSKTMGLIASSGITNDLVEVVTEGLIEGINTGSATKGDPVWLGVDGALIFGLANKPTAPAHLVFLGIVTRAQTNNGEIFVKVQNGFEMNELHNYAEGSVQNNQVIVYESATSLYKPKTIPVILGYTPVPDSRTITINGTTYDLSANRSWTVSANQNARTEYEFTTDGTTATYSAVYSVGQVDVFYNGSKLASTEFTATNGTSVTLSFTPPTGQLVEVVAWETGGGVANGRTLTINGVAYDLSANRSWTIDNASLGAQPQLNGTGLVRMSGTTVAYDNATYATQTYVTTAISNLVNSAPSTLDTLNELATALGNDANFSTTVTNSIATKLPLSGGTLTGSLYLINSTTRLSSDGNGELSINYGTSTTSTYTFSLYSNTTRTIGFTASGAAVFSSSVTATTGFFSSTSGNQLTAYYDASNYMQIQHNRIAIYGNDLIFTTNASTEVMRLKGGNLGLGTATPLGITNNSGVHISKGGHTTLMIGDAVNDGGVLQSSDNSQRLILGANIYDDSTNSWQQFNASKGYAAVDVIASGSEAGMVRILTGNGNDTGYASTNIAFEAYRSNSTAYIKLRVYDIDAVYVNTNGYTGFGTNNPQHRIQANGNIYSTDTVFARNLKPEAWAGPVAGSPTGATIPLGYSAINISSLCDNSWRTLITNINDSKVFMWVTLGDAASKDTASYTWQMTSPAYGVLNMTQISYLDGGWNTGGFEFTYGNPGNGMFSLMVRCSSYYNSGNTAYGTIYFLRLE